MVQVQLARIENDEVKFLLLKRASSELISPNKWQAITGSIEIKANNVSETSLEAASREVFEETGLVVENLVFLQQVAIFYFQPTDTIVMSPIIFGVVSPELQIKLSEEHSDFLWLSKEECKNYLTFETQLSAIEKIEAILIKGLGAGN